MLFDPSYLKDFPTSPGVYLMKNQAGLVLYIGKAKNLRERVRQYFAKGGDGRVMIPFLISQVAVVDTIVVRSEQEALLLELNLIKEHQPKYNALLKDDKTSIALKVTKHTWPKVDVVRYRGRAKRDGLYFGPYANTGSARRTLDLLHKLFPIRQCSDQEFARRTRSCILYDMHRCIAPCVGKCSQEEYQALVTKIVQFLQGKDREVIDALYKEMEQFSETLEFEQANRVLKTIRHLEKTLEKQHVDTPLGADADAFALFREGEEVALVVMFFRGGRLKGMRSFSFGQTLEEDPEILQSFLLQYYETWTERPKEILLPLTLPDQKVVQEHLSAQFERKVSIHVPVRGEKVSLVKMAEMNAEAVFRKERDEGAFREKLLLSIQKKCRLNNFPERMECVDISNLSGSETVGTIVSFKDGKKDSSGYRKYKIRSAAASDDYGAMEEVLTRRFSSGSFPDLLVVDGGKGHLNIALKVMEKLNVISVDVIALAKEESRHDKGATSEQIFLPKVKDPILFKRNAEELFLLQQLRDEAHRTAITFQKKRRSKTLIKSRLDDIPGIGPKKKKALIQHFKTIKAIEEATLEVLQEVKGISERDAGAIYQFFR